MDPENRNIRDMNNPTRRIYATSSTDCLLSDDENSSSIIAGLNLNDASFSHHHHRHHHRRHHRGVSISNSISQQEYSFEEDRSNDVNMSITRDDDDDDDDDAASLYVNAKTEVGSTSSSSKVAKSMRKSSTGGGSGSGKGGVFRGLSKSASKLLSQDSHTLSEMLNVNLNVNVNVGVPKNDEVNVVNDVKNMKDENGTTNTNNNNNNSNNRNNNTHASDGENIGGCASASDRNNEKNERHMNMFRIRKLEERLQQQEEIKKLEMIELERMMERKYQNEIDDLRNQVHNLKSSDINDDAQAKNVMDHGGGSSSNNSCGFDPSISSKKSKKSENDSLVSSMTSDQITRYSRQLLLNDGFGVKGQQKLLSSSVLVIGAGGIGSTVLLYLAASGIGNITVIDFDKVEMSNLHRQIIHKENNIGLNKAVSACHTMKQLNPTITCTAIQDMLTHENALDIVSRHDCVVDACDNPKTRYIVNDACILSGNKPLISGSAMGTEGQLTVYGYKDASCYRCLYPRVNPTEGCKSCSDNGVLGTVPGLIGILQATETIKVLTGIGSTMHDRLLMYDSIRCTFMNIKKLPPRKDCAICGLNPTIKTMQDSKEISGQARGPQPQLNSSSLSSSSSNNTNDISSAKILVSSSIAPEMNVSCKEYEQVRNENRSHLLLDVRVKRQFEMCNLSGAVNIELGNIETQIVDIEKMCGAETPVFCICRRGIASTEAARVLSQNLSSTAKVYNIVGGYNSWVKEVDASFPYY